MKKKIILLIVVGIILGGTAFGYHNINEKYPHAIVKEAEPGETLEYQKGVLISIDNAEILSEEKTNKIISDSNIEPIADSRMINVTIVLENTTQETQELSMTDINLVTDGMANGISKNMADSDSDFYGRLKQVLSPGEIKKVTYPYEMLSSWFNENDWNHIEEREFWLSFSQYPVQTILRLK